MEIFFGYYFSIRTKSTPWSVFVQTYNPPVLSTVKLSKLDHTAEPPVKGRIFTPLNSTSWTTSHDVTTTVDILLLSQCFCLAKVSLIDEVYQLFFWANVFAKTMLLALHCWSASPVSRWWRHHNARRHRGRGNATSYAAKVELQS